MKIRVHILRKNREVVTLNVSPNEDSFEFNDGIYVIDTPAVNVAGEEKRPELYYVEGNPAPVNSEENSNEGKTFLDEFVLKNAMEAFAAEQRPSRLVGFIIDYLKNPAKLLLLGVAVTITIALLSGVLGPILGGIRW